MLKFDPKHFSRLSNIVNEFNSFMNGFNFLLNYVTNNAINIAL